MKALMLAAGLGTRLYGNGEDQPPKVLLRFENKTLLQRHIEILRACGVEELVMVLGYRKDEIEAELQAIGAGDFVRTYFNPDFRDGPVVSMWRARDVLKSGSDILFMDADVLYPPLLLERLIAAADRTCFLFDRGIDAGEDPVRICVRDGRIVDFGKMIEGDFDAIGEWPGFMKMAPAIAARIADATARYVHAGKVELAYEPAMRDVLMDSPPGAFGFEDITGVPWIEIDFPDDLIRAQRIVYPRVAAATAGNDDATASRH
ncbi:MAG: phosphocholine cytidylyltransferase family protein [Rhodospirillales bacterium]|jgi:choline kinase|nr:phosphocholine cytidylyltransferase family protein [Rhodospirillales bacterium]